MKKILYSVLVAIVMIACQKYPELEQVVSSYASSVSALTVTGTITREKSIHTVRIMLNNFFILMLLRT